MTVDVRMEPLMSIQIGRLPMICRECGGKLNVIESSQDEVENDVVIYRIRKCVGCGKRIESFEVVEDTKVPETYKHDKRKNFRF